MLSKAGFWLIFTLKLASASHSAREGGAHPPPAPTPYGSTLVCHIPFHRYITHVLYTAVVKPEDNITSLIIPLKGSWFVKKAMCFHIILQITLIVVALLNLVTVASPPPQQSY